MECGETWNLMVLRVEFKCKSCNLSTKIDDSADSKTKQISQIALFRNLRHLYTILFFFSLNFGTVFQMIYVHSNEK